VRWNDHDLWSRQPVRDDNHHNDLVRVCGRVFVLLRPDPGMGGHAERVLPELPLWRGAPPVQFRECVCHWQSPVRPHDHPGAVL